MTSLRFIRYKTTAFILYTKCIFQDLFMIKMTLLKYIFNELNSQNAPLTTKKYRLHKTKKEPAGSFIVVCNKIRLFTKEDIVNNSFKHFLTATAWKCWRT